MDSIKQLEGQMNAMAHAWLTLVCALEQQAGFDAAGLQRSLRERSWPDDAAVDAEGRRVLGWLCDQLDQSRARRQSGRH